jgi:hypothetical protein
MVVVLVVGLITTAQPILRMDCINNGGMLFDYGNPREG